MRVLVLGGYGLIGLAVVRRLVEDGHEVFALGRNTVSAARRCSKPRWIDADLGHFDTAAHWTVLLAETQAEAVVNAAGVLQDGVRDDVVAVQSTAMRALYRAARERGIARFVQISATRASKDAETLFMSSKGEADAALMSSMLEWTILRPGLVIARDAYGGTALLRALAAFPLVQPMAYGGRPVQTVAVDEVAEAVVMAVDGRLPSRHVYDLVEDHPHSLRQVVLRYRAWLGLPPAPLLYIPKWFLRVLGLGADMLGLLGWRSPLRSTAITELAAGIRGDAALWRAACGKRLSSLDETLSRMPATVQERWFARLWTLKPLIVTTLVLFWVVTGIVTLVELDAATAVLATRGIPAGLAGSIAAIGAIADIALGAAAAVRKWMPLAAKGMIALTLVYLAGGTVLAADLWADPLGPLVKAGPPLVLALVALAIWEER